MRLPTGAGGLAWSPRGHEKSHTQQMRSVAFILGRRIFSGRVVCGLLQSFDTNILEFGPHRNTGVKLKAK